jgi:hypothetical protein
MQKGFYPRLSQRGRVFPESELTKKLLLCTVNPRGDIKTWYISASIRTVGKIRLIEGKAKCCHLKKLTWKGTLQQVFICLRKNPLSPPFTHCIRVCSILIHTWRGGKGESWTIGKGERQSFTKLGRNTIMTDCISSLQPLINTCRKVPLQVNFIRSQHYALPSMSLIFLWFLR